MAEKKPWSIDVMEFLRRGCFGPVRVGSTRAWVEQELGPPENWGMSKSPENASVWVYGPIEIHFEAEHVSMIFSDHLEGMAVADPSCPLNLVPGVFGGAPPTWRKVTEALLGRRTSYTVDWDTIDRLLVHTEGGVTLTFEARSLEEGSEPPDPAGTPCSSMFMRCRDGTLGQQAPRKGATRRGEDFLPILARRLEKWIGAQARLWSLTIGHPDLTILLERTDRPGCLVLRLRGPIHIHAPHFWSNARLQVTVAEGGRWITEDAAANVRIVSSSVEATEMRSKDPGDWPT